MSNQPLSLQHSAKRTLLWPVLGFCAAAGAGLFIAVLVLRHAVAVPMLDDWEMVPSAIKAHTVGLSFADLFEQQQESRTFFPKLIFIALSFGKYWDARVEMMLSILICFLILFGIYRLLAKTGLAPPAMFFALLLSVLLVFSPTQHELWMLASGFPSFVPALCIVWGLCTVRSSLPIAAKFWCCVGLAFFASFTLSNGLLAWGLTFPLLLITNRGPNWRRWFCFWALAATVCAVIYFWGFRTQADLPQFAPRKSFWDYWRYLAAFLGSGLGRAGNENPLAVSIAAGSVLGLGYLLSLGWSFRHWRDRDYFSRLAPWLALGAYSIGNGILAACGRIGWGVEQALESRYVAYSLYLAVALVAMSAVFARDWFKAHTSGKQRTPMFAAVVFLAGTYVLLASLNAAASLPFFPLRSAAARLGQSGILFSQIMDTSGAIRTGNFPRPYFVRENADALDRLHGLRTRLVRSRDFGQLRYCEVSDGVAQGWCDGLNRKDDGTSTAWGWAALTARDRPADAVLLAYADEHGGWNAFALSDAVMDRPDVVRTLKNDDQLWSGWRVVFARTALPADAEISAWAVDAKEAKLYRLKTIARMFNH